MYIQGNLQTIFDALFHMGVIDPVLEMDWHEALTHLPDHHSDFVQVLSVVNSFQGDIYELMARLESFKPEVLSFLAIEVAREYADFHAREGLH